MSLSALLPGTPVKFNEAARPYFFLGARAIVVRVSKATGGVTVRLSVERGAYHIGDEVNVKVYELEVIPHWIVMCEVSGGVTGLRQAPYKDCGFLVTYEREVDALQGAMDLARRVLSPHAKASFKYWPAFRT